MDTISAAALARQLGTSVPRVTRMAGRLGIDARQANGRFAFTPAQVECLREALGSVPAVEGLTRTEVIVLAALRNAPFGLASARAVARRSGLSATAAARALESLRSKRLAELSTQMVAAGAAREMGIWQANAGHPRWPSLDPLLAQVQKPVLPSSPRDKSARVPARLRHLFWNTADTQLEVERAGPYIARRLLRTMDLQGLAWGAKALAAEDWRQAAHARGLGSKTKRLAFNLANHPMAREVPVLPTNLPIEPAMAGLPVAGLHDLMAMKLKVMAERGEMRDYFDVKAIDEQGAVSVEKGVELYMRRYGIEPSNEALPHLYRAMGDLSDVETDHLLPIELDELQRWWSARQVQVLRNSDRFG